MERHIIRRLPEKDLENIIPKQSGIEIENLCIGQKRQHYSYTESVSGHGGNISGGGTKTKSYLAFDFGFGVQNNLNEYMRVGFTIAELDNEGYTIDTRYLWDDFAPNEKKRLWTNYFVTDREKFKTLVIKEIGIGKTPAEGRNGKAIWTSFTNPNISIWRLFKLSKKKLPKSNESDINIVLLAIRALVITAIAVLIFRACN